VRAWTDITLYVNRFEQSVGELVATHLRADIGATHNKGLKEMAGEEVSQAFMLFTNFCGQFTFRVFNPPLS
jgi:hypothetical protein